MDNKNVFVAIALSMSVLLFWGAFVEQPENIKQTATKLNQIEKKSNTNNISPNINDTLEIKNASREE